VGRHHDGQEPRRDHRDLNDLLYDRDKVVDEWGNPKEIIHVSANPKYGSEKKGAPTAYFMVAAPERIRVNCDLRHANVVLCCDPKAFTHCNPLDGMQEGGCLIWESEEEGEQAWERLPLWARQQIIEKKIRVFTLPGFEIARKATDRGDLQLRMQGNAFLGGFSRCRRCSRSSAFRPNNSTRWCISST
jgi:pyruvate-ferredoxin/flavodoxin oxidoreductase